MIMQVIEYFPYPAIANNVEIISFKDLGDILLSTPLKLRSTQDRFLCLAVMWLGLDRLFFSIFERREIIHKF